MLHLRYPRYAPEYSRGTRDQLPIEKAVLENCRRRLTNLSIACIDCKKTDCMVLHDFKIFENGRHSVN